MPEQQQQQGANSVVILPSCLFHVGNTVREQDLLNLPPPSCSSNPGSTALFQLRTKTSMGASAGYQGRNTAASNAARKNDDTGKRN
mmetsp:Transcript_82390/g.209419  ORF Transcript_82390/g.209419 Transcript_82390/m.209419 type:complete len:86 (-) Transcript_82390:77-334(-)|eukprot:CAMPEP_0183428372 /NCGR_PEP_ID=MMETSP0370-20130417/44369_1 /TAXON_ID=268820 /ORGANISM="Peridinium aciculiferum, Strain PAER-2" /LENGTH=85 /DNA_ID=CAMNT_0025613139 /DNA_START=106 /DNA_END=363 /DNA_ORIENTATION=+